MKRRGRVERSFLAGLFGAAEDDGIARELPSGEPGNMVPGAVPPHLAARIKSSRPLLLTGANASHLRIRPIVTAPHRWRRSAARVAPAREPCPKPRLKSGHIDLERLLTRYLFAVAALLVFSSCRSATDPEPDLNPSGELVALVSGAVNDDFLASGSYPPPGPGIANTFASAHPALPPGMYNVMAIRKRGVVHDVVILELYEMFGPDEYPARGRFQHDRPNHGSTLRN